MLIFYIISDFEIEGKIRLITLKYFAIYLQQFIYSAGIINEDFPGHVISYKLQTLLNYLSNSVNTFYMVNVRIHVYTYVDT